MTARICPACREGLGCIFPKPCPKQVSLDLYGTGHTESITYEKPVLRDYQLEGVARLREAIGEGNKRCLLVLPTGGGKTVVAASIIDSAVSKGKRVLFIAHRIELINQTAKQVARWGVTDIGVIRANDHRSNPAAPVQVASIMTLVRREADAYGTFDIVFIDEAHMSMSESYQAIVARYPDAILIGLTATPFRGDNKGLGEVYQALIVVAKPSQLVASGAILEPRAFRAPQLPDLGDVGMVASDYNLGQLARAVNKPKLVGNIVGEWRARADGRKTVVFAVNVQHSKDLCQAFRDDGVRAAHVDANTPADERALILNNLRNGELEVVCNVDVLCEGWDEPAVKCAVLARPTESLRIHLQQCGRILRPYGDTTALLLDHAGNLRHGMPTWDRDYDLTLGQSRKPSPTLRTCDQCYAMWTGTAAVCPECGFVKVPKPREAIETEAGDLIEMKPNECFTEEDREKTDFWKLAVQCRERGWKPGAAGAKWKDKYKRWPPWAWKVKLDAAYAKDTAWQAAVHAASVKREYWQGKQAIADEVAERELDVIREEIRSRPPNPALAWMHKPKVADEGFTAEPEDES